MLRKVLKKVTGMTLALVMLATTAPISRVAYADEETELEKVGLSIISDATGLEGALKNAVNRKQIQVIGDDFMVFSHPESVYSSYYISSETLLAAISSTNGYELSYVDDNKEAAETNDVKGGYIKAEKDGEMLYLPIKIKGTEYLYPENEITGDGSKVVVYNPDDSGLTTTNNKRLSGLGGKETADTAWGISLDESQIIPDGKFPRYEYLVTIDENLNSRAPFTYEFNLYFDGDMQPAVYVNGQKLLHIDGDGYIYAHKDGSGGATTYNETKYDTQLAKGRWHRMAVVWERSRNRFAIYADGVCVAASGSIYLADSNTAWFRKQSTAANTAGLANNSIRIGAYAGSKSGKLAIDDVYEYIGHYYKDADKVSVSGTNSSMEVDTSNKVITFNSNNLYTAADLNTAVKGVFGTGYAALCSPDIIVTADDYSDFSGNEIMTVTSPSGRVYDYYSIKLDDGTKYDVNFNDQTASDIQIKLYNDGLFKADYVGGVAGKADDDYAVAITADASKTTASSGYNLPTIEYPQSEGFDDNIITFETQIYCADTTTNKSVRVLYKQGAETLTRWLAIFSSTGVIQSNISKGVNIPYSAGRWYKVACQADKNSGTWTLFINGEQVAQDIVEFDTIGTRFCVSESYNLESEDNGVSWHVSDIQKDDAAMFDNYRVYARPYDAQADAIAPISYSGDEFVVDEDNKQIIAKNLDAMTAGEIKELIGISAEVYSDSTYMTKMQETDTLTVNSILVLKSESGEVFDYYSFAKNVGKVKFVSADNKMKATVKYCFDDQICTMYISKTQDGYLHGVEVVELGTKGEGVAEIEADSDPRTYSLFIWDKDLRPMADRSYTVK